MTSLWTNTGSHRYSMPEVIHNAHVENESLSTTTRRPHSLNITTNLMSSTEEQPLKAQVDVVETLSIYIILMYSVVDPTLGMFSESFFSISSLQY